MFSPRDVRIITVITTLFVLTAATWYFFSRDTHAHKEIKRSFGEELPPEDYFSAGESKSSSSKEERLTVQDSFEDIPVKEETSSNKTSGRKEGEVRARSYVYVWKKERGGEKTDASKDKDFMETGEERHDASYPVDLSRVVTADRFINAVLETEVKSELASEKVIAVVEDDVVGFHGRQVLIPRGSRVLGRYVPMKKVGDTRVAIEWYRILTPEGINIRTSAEGADGEGGAGLTGVVDQRYKDRYGMAFLVSAISSGAQLSVPVENDKAKAAADSFSYNLSLVTTEALRRGLDLEPRLRIPKGARIVISPLVDIWFKEPRFRTVQVEELREK